MMFRRLFRLSLLGVLTTVIVAWGCALLIKLPGDVYTPSQVRRVAFARTHLDLEQQTQNAHPPALLLTSADLPDKPSVYATVWSRFGGVYIYSGTNVGYFPAADNAKPMEEVIGGSMRRHAVPWLTGDASWPGRDVHRFLGARGWPFLALWCEFKTTATPPWNGIPRGGIQVPWPRVKPGWYVPPPPVTTLPYFPLWAGLLGDSAIFAAAWWVVLGGLRRVREQARLRRGRCAQCGYDRRGIGEGVCPECGHAPVRSVAALSTPGVMES